MSRPSCVIVEICESNDNRADELVETNKDLGHRIYQYRGALLTILVTDLVWKSPKSDFIEVKDGVYHWREDRFVRV